VSLQHLHYQIRWNLVVCALYISMNEFQYQRQKCAALSAVFILFIYLFGNTSHISARPFQWKKSGPGRHAPTSSLFLRWDWGLLTYKHVHDSQLPLNLFLFTSLKSFWIFLGHPIASWNKVTRTRFFSHYHSFDVLAQVIFKIGFHIIIFYFIRKNQKIAKFFLKI
jgi:hypothetical protein